MQSQIHIAIERACLLNQVLSKIRIDPPISRFVGVGKRGLLYRRSKSRVVELSAMRGQAHFDVAQTLTASQLGKRHCQELLPTGQMPDTPVAVVAMDESIKIVVRDQLEELSKNGLSTIHQPYSRADDRSD